MLKLEANPRGEGARRGEGEAGAGCATVTRAVGDLTARLYPHLNYESKAKVVLFIHAETDDF